MSGRDDFMSDVTTNILPETALERLKAEVTWVERSRYTGVNNHISGYRINRQGDNSFEGVVGRQHEIKRVYSWEAES